MSVTFFSILSSYRVNVSLTDLIKRPLSFDCGLQCKNKLKLKGIRAILKPRIFKFRENQMREIQEVPVHR